ATAGMLRALSIRYAQGRPREMARSARESR
ncbi:MAG: coenzyme A pyrophosphatase, partial [Oceanicaulis sp.]|nr:coenzyme A pyrophosphatase [Oceanicaulis sp.]